ncbi:hypothetical protein NOCA2150150 [metagenome]|uniref:Uncharacterized protein n=1 Tax=metagenome TaxID=256318 RepID=A0A2P2BXC9_9ZZZZ
MILGPEKTPVFGASNGLLTL